ncbi:MAG: hypothetical protein K2G90_07790 [Muribaculaceae bacterium]|nr:hypothetical protein [Muribaculaceae bacterium]
MKTISVLNLTNAPTLKKGNITLYGSTGIGYYSDALFIPSYGWVPCSIKLKKNFSTAPKDLKLIISEKDDEYIPVTSSVWVTRA